MPLVSGTDKVLSDANSNYSKSIKIVSHTNQQSLSARKSPVEYSQPATDPKIKLFSWLVNKVTTRSAIVVWRRVYLKQPDNVSPRMSRPFLMGT